MKYFTAKQLSCPTPDTFNHASEWRRGITLQDWMKPYVLELSYTSWRLKPYAQDLGDDGPPFHWDPERRALLRADLDGAFLHVYGLSREQPNMSSSPSSLSANTRSVTSVSTAPSALSLRPTTVWPTQSPTAARDGDHSPTFQRDAVHAMTNEHSIS